jgi:heme exporter protein A
MVALLGGNGAGKTTLLRVAATLLRPTRGGGRVLGHSLESEAATVRHRIGVMSFSPGLYEDLSADENLRFACKMRGERPDLARIANVLEQVGLAAHAAARVRGFSSGMRRRVALARVLLTSPDLLLLDEPYAALDEEGADLINQVIAGVVARGGAVMAATHDLPRALPVVDRVVRIDDGLLREIPLKPDLLVDAGLPRITGANPEKWLA